MKIYFDGCAKTYGAAVQHNIKQRYSTLLCDKLGAEEYNIAIAEKKYRLKYNHGFLFADVL